MIGLSITDFSKEIENTDGSKQLSTRVTVTFRDLRYILYITF